METLKSKNVLLLIAPLLFLTGIIALSGSKVFLGLFLLLGITSCAVTFMHIKAKDVSITKKLNSKKHG
jgi:hypothetical protein